jgi:hypothetical protein
LVHAAFRSILFPALVMGRAQQLPATNDEMLSRSLTQELGDVMGAEAIPCAAPFFQSSAPAGTAEQTDRKRAFAEVAQAAPSTVNVQARGTAINIEDGLRPPRVASPPGVVVVAASPAKHGPGDIRCFLLPGSISAPPAASATQAASIRVGVPRFGADAVAAGASIAASSDIPSRSQGSQSTNPDDSQTTQVYYCTHECAKVNFKDNCERLQHTVCNGEVVWRDAFTMLYAYDVTQLDRARRTLAKHAKEASVAKPSFRQQTGAQGRENIAWRSGLISRSCTAKLRAALMEHRRAHREMW